MESAFSPALSNGFFHCCGERYKINYIFSNMISHLRSFWSCSSRWLYISIRWVPSSTACHHYFATVWISPQLGMTSLLWNVLTEQNIANWQSTTLTEVIKENAKIFSAENDVPPTCHRALNWDSFFFGCAHLFMYMTKAIFLMERVTLNSCRTHPRHVWHESYWIPPTAKILKVICQESKDN